MSRSGSMRMPIVVAAIFAVSATSRASVQGPGPGGAIPDASQSNVIPGVFNSTITVSSPGIVATLNSVTLTFGPSAHTRVGDLQVILRSPSGANVHLLSRPGATG